MNTVRRQFRPMAEGLEGRIAPATLPTGFVESTLVDGLNKPTVMEFAPDGRLFVAEQRGTLRVVRDGALLDRPFLTLDVDSRQERGLIGLAFDPRFEENGYVYVCYTVPGSPAHNRVSRFEAVGDVARPGSERVLLDLDPLSSATFHNGGALKFAPDGTLFVAVGDNAQPDLAQRLDSRFGKILRINADGTIPDNNPFVDTARGPNRAIWALGLRNPFTLAVRPGDGALFINDVGQSAFEEIDLGRPGANYGWPVTEGPTDDPRFDAPLFSFGHGDDPSTNGCSIIGGAFVPVDGSFPDGFEGDYLFADFCNGWVRRLDPANGAVDDFVSGLPAGTADLDIGPDGALYVLSRGRTEASVIRIAPPEPVAPPVEPPSPPTPEPPAPTPEPTARIGDEAFVRQLYRDVLGREADPGGLGVWLGMLGSGTSRVDVVRAFVRSEERLEGVVADAYRTLLGRAPDPGGLATWVGLLRGGGTRSQVIAGIAGSEEYLSRQGGTPSGFVAGLYRDVLGRSAGPPEVEAWLGVLATAPRSAVASAIAGSEEAFLARVSGLYDARLRRPLAESDRPLWIEQYRLGIRADVAEFYITASPEYTDRRV